MRGGRSVLRAVAEEGGEALVTAQFFRSQAAFRKWLEKHHDKEKELIVGFYNVASGRGGLTYKQALDEALCFGWIDGVRRNLDADSYTNRFTPRKAKSYWSEINTKRFHELAELGRVAEPGQKAFDARDPAKTKEYSFERERAVFDAALEKRFRANKQAWAFFEAQPPGYRRMITWWVVSAKKEETRASRLEKLIAASEAGKRL
jgi:uncharacterized protein YdeI (YjbR/CyaY-like superfamily)